MTIPVEDRTEERARCPGCGHGLDVAIESDGHAKLRHDAPACAWFTEDNANRWLQDLLRRAIRFAADLT